MTKRHAVRSYYDQYADNYDKFYSSIQYDKFRNLSTILQSCPYLIDLGGGSGLLAAWIAFPLFNFDLSLNMLRSGLDQRDYQAIAMDLQSLPLRDKCISDAISLTAYQNTENISKAFEELYRALSHDGIAIVTILKKSQPKSNLKDIFMEIGFTFQYIPLSGEDHCFSLRSSSSISKSS